MQERPYKYTTDEHYPVEQLVFKINPEDLDEFLKVDHEVWTLGEAFLDVVDRIPFLSKEVWINENRPGIITVVFEWENRDEWLKVDVKPIQKRLIDLFNSKFTKPYKLLRCIENEENFGIHRVSRFERI
jgi:uncharacterized protein (TIGR03792 family)